jgi:hypothetical protein
VIQEGEKKRNYLITLKEKSSPEELEVLKKQIEQLDARLQEMREIEKIPQAQVERELKKVESRLVALKELRTQAASPDFKDMATLFKEFKGDPEKEKALFNHFLVHASLQQGLHFEKQLVKEQVANYESVGVSLQAKIDNPNTAKAQVMRHSSEEMTAMVTVAKMELNKQATTGATLLKKSGPSTWSMKSSDQSLPPMGARLPSFKGGTLQESEALANRVKSVLKKSTYKPNRQAITALNQSVSSRRHEIHDSVVNRSTIQVGGPRLGK